MGLKLTTGLNSITEFKIKQSQLYNRNLLNIDRTPKTDANILDPLAPPPS